MHQAESPCIDSMVLDTPWKRRSKDVSSAAVELRAPGPLTAAESAAIFPIPTVNDGDGVAAELKKKKSGEGAKQWGKYTPAPFWLHVYRDQNYKF